MKLCAAPFPPISTWPGHPNMIPRLLDTLYTHQDDLVLDYLLSLPADDVCRHLSDSPGKIFWDKFARLDSKLGDTFVSMIAQVTLENSFTEWYLFDYLAPMPMPRLHFSASMSVIQPRIPSFLNTFSLDKPFYHLPLFLPNTLTQALAGKIEEASPTPFAPPVDTAVFALYNISLYWVEGSTGPIRAIMLFFGALFTYHPSVLQTLSRTSIPIQLLDLTKHANPLIFQNAWEVVNVYLVNAGESGLDATRVQACLNAGLHKGTALEVVLECFMVTSLPPDLHALARVAGLPGTTDFVRRLALRWTPTSPPAWLGVIQALLLPLVQARASRELGSVVHAVYKTNDLSVWHKLDWTTVIAYHSSTVYTADPEERKVFKAISQMVAKMSK